MASSTQCRSDLPVRTPSATAWPNASRASLRDAPLRLGNGPGSKRCDNGLIRRSAREKLPAPCRINTSTWTNMLGKAKQCREILQATGLNHEAHLKTSTMSHTWPRKVELPEFSSWLFGAGLPTLPSADCSARVSRPCRPLTVRRGSPDPAVRSTDISLRGLGLETFGRSSGKVWRPCHNVVQHCEKEGWLFPDHS